MKDSWIAACSAVLILSLTGCGGGSSSAMTTPSPYASSTASPSASATPISKVVPNLIGKPTTDAVKAMNNALLSSIMVGPDGIAWTAGPSKSAKVVSTDPPPGATTTAETVKLVVDMDQADAQAADDKAAAAAAAAAELAVRYTITCGYDYSTPTFKSYKDVWSSSEYASSDKCSVQIDGQYVYSSEHKIPLLPSEQAIVNVVASKGGEVGNPAEVFTDVMALCATVPKQFPDTIVGLSGTAEKPVIQGALALCPDAPHAALLQQALTVVKYDSGRSYTVGKDMDPGTYSTRPGVKDCYWSRTTGSGDVIANDFIDYAPTGVAVTVYAGEGFTANGCGVWTKVG
jgi:hypothetical protein